MGKLLIALALKTHLTITRPGIEPATSRLLSLNVYFTYIANIHIIYMSFIKIVADRVVYIYIRQCLNNTWTLKLHERIKIEQKVLYWAEPFKFGT